MLKKANKKGIRINCLHDSNVINISRFDDDVMFTYETIRVSKIESKNKKMTRDGIMNMAPG